MAGNAIFFRGGLFIPLLSKDRRQSGAGPGKIRLEADSRSQCLGRLGQLAHLFAYCTQSVIGLSIVRLEANRLLVSCYRVLVAAKVAIRCPQVAVRLGIVRLETNRLLVSR